MFSNDKVSERFTCAVVINMHVPSARHTLETSRNVHISGPRDIDIREHKYCLDTLTTQKNIIKQYRNNGRAFKLIS